MTEISLEASIDDIVIGKKKKGSYVPVKLVTNRGDVKCRYYHCAGSKKAVIFVGGKNGGFESPAGNLYSELSRTLNLHNISSLHVKLRYPNDLVESVMDVMIAITFLERFGIEEIGLVGYSIGGAVAIQAAASTPDSVRTVVTLATQAYGTEVASSLDHTSLLLIHGLNDEIMPVYSSTYVHDIAQGEKQLLLYKGATHKLLEVSKPVKKEIQNWLLTHLR